MDELKREATVCFWFFKQQKKSMKTADCHLTYKLPLGWQTTEYGNFIAYIWCKQINIDRNSFLCLLRPNF